GRRAAVASTTCWRRAIRAGRARSGNACCCTGNSPAASSCRGADPYPSPAKGEGFLLCCPRAGQEEPMGEILGLGVTNYPPLIGVDENMAGILMSTLKSERVPAAAKDPASWPEPMRKEFEANRNAGAAAEHRRRHREAFRHVRQALDQFRPDFVLV